MTSYSQNIGLPSIQPKKELPPSQNSNSLQLSTRQKRVVPMWCQNTGDLMEAILSGCYSIQYLSSKQYKVMTAYINQMLTKPINLFI